MTNTRSFMKILSVALILIALLLLMLTVYLGANEAAWTSHHVELARIIDHCPGQHTATQQALADRVLQRAEANSLIERCSLEIIDTATKQ